MASSHLTALLAKSEGTSAHDGGDCVFGGSFAGHLHPMVRQCHWALNQALTPLLAGEGSVQRYFTGEFKRCMSIEQSSAVGALKSDPVFLHVKAGMTVIVTDTEGAWRMADVIWVDGGARNPKVPTLFQVADVDTGVINWINADLVTHICPRV